MTTTAPAKTKSQEFKPQPWRDRRIEIILGNLLRAGVMLSALIVLSGACVYLWRHGHEQANYRVFQGEPSEFRTIPGILRSVMHGRGRGLIQLGLLFLIATPIARVCLSVVGFSIERDRLYIVCTLIVLAILLYSFVGSGFTL
jgi:Predicted membrane protein